MGALAARPYVHVNHRWLVLRLEAPMAAFGDVAIDQVGPVRDFPTASMLTGLVANALGWVWSDRAAHHSLQSRIVFGARRESEGTVLTDTQNAHLSKVDRGWTTLGTPEGRAGDSYRAPHRRLRDYHADLAVGVAMRLEPPGTEPTLRDVADALDRPARPLFIGRKNCLPARPLLDPGETRWVEASTAHEALARIPGEGSKRATWPLGEGPDGGDDVDRILDVSDIRDWRVGLHAGTRRIVEGRVTPAAPP